MNRDEITRLENYLRKLFDLQTIEVRQRPNKDSTPPKPERYLLDDGGEEADLQERRVRVARAQEDALLHPTGNPWCLQAHPQGRGGPRLEEGLLDLRASAATRLGDALDHERFVAQVAQTKHLAERSPWAHLAEVEGRGVDSDAGSFCLPGKSRASQGQAQTDDGEEASHDDVPLAARPRGFFFDSVSRRM